MPTMRLSSMEVPQPVIAAGTINETGLSCRYSIFQPAVTQWVAVGILEFEHGAAPILLVESADSANNVLDALRRRVAVRRAQHTQRLASLAA